MIVAGRHNVYLREEVAAGLSRWGSGSGADSIADCMRGALRALDYVAASARSLGGSLFGPLGCSTLQRIYNAEFGASSGASEFVEQSEFLGRISRALQAEKSGKKIATELESLTESELCLAQFFLRRGYAAEARGTAYHEPRPSEAKAAPKAATTKRRAGASS